MTEINLNYMKPTTLAAIIADLADEWRTQQNAGRETTDVVNTLREVGQHAVNADGLETLIGNIRRVDSRR